MQNGKSVAGAWAACLVFVVAGNAAADWLPQDRSPSACHSHVAWPYALSCQFSGNDGWIFDTTWNTSKGDRVFRLGAGGLGAYVDIHNHVWLQQ